MFCAVRRISQTLVASPACRYDISVVELRALGNSSAQRFHGPPIGTYVFIVATFYVDVI